MLDNPANKRISRAEENVGRQFKRIFGVAEWKMTFNEAVLNCFRWANREDTSRAERLRGINPKYGMFNRSTTPADQKKRKWKNDGRPPDKASSIPRSTPMNFQSSGKRAVNQKLYVACHMIRWTWKLQEIRWSWIYVKKLYLKNCLYVRLPWLLLKMARSTQIHLFS